MALEPLTLRQSDLIVSSLRKVFKTGDIKYLTNSAYKFVMLSSGFIAHYNLHGFRDTYSDVNRLREEIVANERWNQWNNFSPRDRDYAYMMQKKDIYNRIVASALND